MNKLRQKPFTQEKENFESLPEMDIIQKMLTKEKNNFNESDYADPDEETFMRELDKNLGFKKYVSNEQALTQKAEALRMRAFKIRNNEFDVNPLSKEEIQATQRILDRLNNPSLWQKFRNWLKSCL